MVSNSPKLNNENSESLNKLINDLENSVEQTLESDNENSDKPMSPESNNENSVQQMSLESKIQNLKAEINKLKTQHALEKVDILEFPNDDDPIKFDDVITDILKYRISQFPCDNDYVMVYDEIPITKTLVYNIITDEIGGYEQRRRAKI